MEFGVVRQNPSLASSWSWASVNTGEINQNFFTKWAQHTGRPLTRATILEVKILNVGNDPYGQVLSSSLKIRAHLHPIEWPTQMTPHYNECHPNVKLMNQWRSDVRESGIAKPGQIICTVDERADAWHYEQKSQECRDQISESRHRDLICRQAIYARVARFGYRKEVLNTDAEGLATVHALLLEPTG